MKKTLKISGMMITLIALFLLSSVNVQAQDEPEAVTEEQPKERPARPAFESGIVFDDATTTIQSAGTLEMVIQHRFGTMENGIEDLFGLWAPSNIRLGINYSILNNLMVGIGTTKFNKMQDIQLKYNVIQQTRSNSIPVTVSLYEIVGINALAEENFGVDYKFAHRLSYFSQVIISRRFNDNFSLQFAPGFTHYNSTDSLVDHDRISLSAAARYKFSPQSSLIFSGTWPLFIQGISEQNEQHNEMIKRNHEREKPNITIGWEISTSTHAFHIYLGSAQNILPQENIMLNKNDFFDGGILLGLNITRLWSF